MLKRSIGCKTRRAFLRSGGFAVGSVLLAACGGSGPAASTEPTAAAPSAKPAEGTATPDPDETAVPTPDGKPTATNEPGVVTLDIGTATGATEFKYDKDTLEAAAGSKIKLTFTNNTATKDEVGHNWVLVKPGQEDSVLANAKEAGDARDWLKPNDPGIIAHTKLIEGGKGDAIAFDAPASGTYTYLCTFPDRYAAGMKGILTIK